MKKLIVAIVIIFLPMMSMAGEGSLDRFYPAGWLCMEYTDLTFSYETLTSNADYRTNTGYALSVQAPLHLLDMNLVLTGSMSGYNFNKYEIQLDFQRQLFWGWHTSAGVNYTGWDLLNNIQTEPGIGYQIALEHSIFVQEEDIMAFQIGYKYNTGKLKDIDIDITSNAFFFRIGAYMGF